MARNLPYFLLLGNAICKVISLTLLEILLHYSSVRATCNSVARKEKKQFQEM